MENILPIVAKGLVIAAVAILIASLIPIKRLVEQLPRGAMCAKWSLLIVLIFVFIASLIVYTNGRQRYIYTNLSDLLVPSVFFCGACFVMMVNVLALQTTRDLKRIAVLEEENITDPLTGLYNRRFLEQQLRQEVARAQRYQFPLSVLLLDVDHFKDVNDKHGHPVGDVVLRKLASLLIEAVRSNDFVARYGGDEVTILAPHTAMSDALILAERLRRSVQSTSFLFPDNDGGPQELSITVSIGVGCVDADAHEVHELVAAADEALYHAKHDGRNRVAVSHVGHALPTSG